MGIGKDASYRVMVTNWTGSGTEARSNSLKSFSKIARLISRARSARKLKKNTPSPSPIRPSTPWMTTGLTNSSFSPASYEARMAANGSSMSTPTPVHQSPVGDFHALEPLVPVHGIKTTGDRRNLPPRRFHPSFRSVGTHSPGHWSEPCRVRPERRERKRPQPPSILAISRVA